MEGVCRVCKMAMKAGITVVLAKLIFVEVDMKKLTAIFTIILLMAMTVTAMAASAINQDGYYKGIKLCGRVKVVEHFADIKVKVVDSFPDLKVKVVESFPDAIGEWKFVESGEDFTVQFVDSFPDIKIKYVNSFPGVE